MAQACPGATAINTVRRHQNNSIVRLNTFALDLDLGQGFSVLGSGLDMKQTFIPLSESLSTIIEIG